MSEEQLKAFLEKVKGDTALQEKLKAAANTAAVVAIANAAGFAIAAEELQESQSDISEEELEGASGGGCKKGTCLVNCSCSQPTGMNK